MIILNLKNYLESTGPNLINIINDVKFAAQEDKRIKDIVAISPAVYDLNLAIQNADGIQIFAQHIDFKKAGSTTGWTPAESMKHLNVNHSVLNHSERRHPKWEDLEDTIKHAHDLDIKLIVCCENLDEAKKLLKLKPFAIAYEDKELIGSGQSITTGKPEEVKRFIDLVNGKAKAIIGAGISSSEDITKGLEFGADGFILASAFVKASDKKAKILELTRPFFKN
ncbi:triose-phosphate isomerase [Candidatus Dojkabacteria bacterium]|nr:triose-phosphate isomerase [Candidatus Dojkabacteria bacterium]